MDCHNIPHLFCTRSGGVSHGCFESLNVSYARKNTDGFTDKRENVFKNFSIALSAINSSPDSAVCAKQVHGCEILQACDCDSGRGIYPDSDKDYAYDGVFILSDREKVDTACVKTADCVPILMADISNGNVCSVHAGWRGTVGDIVTNALLQMDVKPENVVCAIGPCIDKCCYEVGEMVYKETKYLFDKKGLTSLDKVLEFSCIRDGEQKYKLDLAGVNRELLLHFGVRQENIDVSRLCTCCTKTSGGPRFFSHRAMNGHSGTFLSAIKTFTPSHRE